MMFTTIQRRILISSGMLALLFISLPVNDLYTKIKWVIGKAMQNELSSELFIWVLVWGALVGSLSISIRHLLTLSRITNNAEKKQSVARVQAHTSMAVGIGTIGTFIGIALAFGGDTHHLLTAVANALYTTIVAMSAKIVIFYIGDILSKGAFSENGGLHV